jgi:hypothetical protein
MTAIGDFLTLVVIGAFVGLTMTRYGRSWFGRHFAGTVGASDVTYVLVGIAGSFMGFHIGLIVGALSPVLMYVLAAIGAAATVFLWRGR